jgi:hypothetical protein
VGCPALRADTLAQIVILLSAVEAGSVMEPAGAGLVSASPDMPAHVVFDAVPASGEQVGQAFHLGDGEGDQARVGWWGVVGAAGCGCQVAAGGASSGGGDGADGQGG